MKLFKLTLPLIIIGLSLLGMTIVLADTDPTGSAQPPVAVMNDLLALESQTLITATLPQAVIVVSDSEGGLLSVQSGGTLTMTLAPGERDSRQFKYCNSKSNPDNTTVALIWSIAESFPVSGAEWLESISPTSGTIPAPPPGQLQNCQTLTAVFDARGLQPDVFRTTLTFKNATASKTLPDVTLTVELTVCDDCDDIQLTPCIPGKYFLKDVSVENRYDATMEDVIEGTIVQFDLNNNSQTIPLPSDGSPAQQFYDMGRDLNYGLLPPTNNTLSVNALLPSGNEVGPSSTDLVGVVIPTWLLDPPEVELEGNCRTQEQASLTYRGNVSYPEEPFSAKLEAHEVPDWIPFLGGEALGIKETQASFIVETTPIGETSTATLEGYTGLTIGGQEIDGYAKGIANITLSDDKGLQIDSADLELKVNGQIKAKDGIGNLICKAATFGQCPLEKSEELPVVGKYIKKLNKALPEVEASVEPDLSGTANFKSENDELEWQDSTLNSTFKVTLSSHFKIGDDVQATVMAGGEPSATYQFPPNPSYVKDLSLTVFGGVEVTAFSYFSCKYNAAYTWAYPSGSGERGTTANDDNGCSINSPFDFKEPITYGVFNPTFIRRSNSLVETIIMTNLPVRGQHTVAAGESNLLLWTQTENNKPLLQGDEIYYTVQTGASWSTPKSITSDSLQDFSPQVAFDQNNKAIAIWQRNKNIQFETSTKLNTAYTTGFEIAYSVWDGNTWTIPTLLTNNNAYDSAPTLVRGNDGQLLAIWRQNDAGELLGDNINPDKLIFAIWNGTLWSTPQTVTELAGLLEYSAARHNNTTMTIVYSQDIDGDYGTDADVELYRMAWDGSSWDNPQRLTNNNTAENTPKIFFANDGSPQLVWLQENSLYGSIGNFNGMPKTITTDGTAAMIDYRATQNDDDNLILLWQGLGDSGTDLFYTVYNVKQNAFSDARKLTNDELLDSAPVPTFGPDGDLLLAYNKSQIDTNIVPISQTLEVEGLSIGQTDLHILSESINFNALDNTYLPFVKK